MLPKYEYRRRLPHYQKDYRPLFVTFTTDRRWELPPAARDIVLECCRREDGKKFGPCRRCHARSCTPDLLGAAEAGWMEYSLPEILKSIKGRSARQINLALKRSGPVWQEEFFDHVLRSNDSLVDRVDYVCQNPVRAGLVKTRPSIRGFGNVRSLSSDAWKGEPAAWRPPDRVNRPGPTQSHIDPVPLP